jgi:hypothetical protein
MIEPSWMRPDIVFPQQIKHRTKHELLQQPLNRLHDVRRNDAVRCTAEGRNSRRGTQVVERASPCQFAYMDRQKSDG